MFKIVSFQIRLPLFLLLVCLASTSALAESLLDWTTSIRSLCMSPDQPGKYWDVNAHGNVEGAVRVKLIGNASANTGVTFSKGEWDGIQKVLKEQQADEHKNYRDCVRDIVPMLKDKVSIDSSEEKKTEEIKKGISLLDIPLNTSKENIKTEGKWVVDDGKTYYKSSQSLLGFPFQSYSKFENNRATLAILQINKEYSSTRYTSGNESKDGSRETVRRYCFGDRYEEILSNLIGALGAPSAPRESDQEDRSAESIDNAGWCKSNSAATCNKHWKQEYRTDFFSNGDELVEFTASYDYGDRSSDLPGVTRMFSSFEWKNCDWVVRISKSVR